MTGAIAFVLKGYPRRSETFIANEIRALEKRGLGIRIVSLRYPIDAKSHPVQSETRDGIPLPTGRDVSVRHWCSPTSSIPTSCICMRIFCTRLPR